MHRCPPTPSTHRPTRQHRYSDSLRGIAIVWLVDLEVQRRAVLHMHDVLAESAEDRSPSGESRGCVRRRGCVLLRWFPGYRGNRPLGGKANAKLVNQSPEAQRWRDRGNCRSARRDETRVMNGSDRPAGFPQSRPPVLARRSGVTDQSPRLRGASYEIVKVSTHLEST